MKHPAAHQRLLQQFIAANIFSRCGQAVTRLSEAALLPRPELPDSETEVREWWLVSPQLARALSVAGQPVLQFHELHMWGRTRLGGELWQDADLAAVAEHLVTPPVPSGGP